MQTLTQLPWLLGVSRLTTLSSRDRSTGKSWTNPTQHTAGVKNSLPRSSACSCPCSQVAGGLLYRLQGSENPWEESRSCGILTPLQSAGERRRLGEVPESLCMEQSTGLGFSFAHVRGGGKEKKSKAARKAGKNPAGEEQPPMGLCWCQAPRERGMRNPSPARSCNARCILWECSGKLPDQHGVLSFLVGLL